MTTELMPERTSVQVLAAVNRIEIDMQIATAKQWPRDIVTIKRNVLEAIESDREIAEKCFYNLPRGGGVKGPSVRLAELFYSEWGNLRVKTRLVEEGATSVTCAADIIDLEKNSAYSCECRKSIMTSAKNGKEAKRFDDDMVTVATNATASTAFRNAVFKIIPGVYIREAYETARKVAVGDIRSIKERTAKCLATFAKMDVDPAQILAFLGIDSVEKITGQHIEDLIGVHNAIRDGETTIEEVFTGEVQEKPATNRKPKGKTIAEVRNEAMSTPPPEFDEPEQAELPQGREPGEEG